MQLQIHKLVEWLLLGILLVGCSQQQKGEYTMFDLLDAGDTGILFHNAITPDAVFNLLDFEYLYNGGGVGVGDFDNDGWPDLVFTGNMVDSKIYLNKKALRFEELPANSGFSTAGKWCTGVTVADVNTDGLDDIYICVGGPGKKSVFPNLLFINQGNLTFKEEAAAYGLADPNESNHAAFFDYDLDGDLDMYLLNGGGFEKSPIMVKPLAKDGSARNTDKLYQNNFDEALGHAVFTDVSKAAGIQTEGFGLGLGIFDANNDGWPDIYAGNDYLSPDLLHINQQDGTFTEAANQYFGHTSHFSMGNDIADVNNDGRMDLITLDMLPEQHYRRMMMFGPNQYDRFYQAVQYGYGFQYMRNMLQVANPDYTFSEIGQLAGIDRTDWSWCPLLADFDNDGFKDIYITNGYGKDITDLDYVKYKNEAIGAFASADGVRATLLKSLNDRPAISLTNYLFKNRGDLTFENATQHWAALPASISNGAAYADLDNDGDLDLVTNNIDQPAFVHKNLSSERYPAKAHYLQIRLEGTQQNPKGIGATICVFSDSLVQCAYQQTARGFQGCVSDIVHFGLGKTTQIDSLTLRWPDGKSQTISAPPINQRITIAHSDAQPRGSSNSIAQTLFTKINLLAFKHKDAITPQDYKTQPLLLHGFTQQGPCMAVADVNSDGQPDFYIGGAYGQSGSVFIRAGEQGFKEIPVEGVAFEDTGAIFFDLDKDGDQDLYVASGGSERYTGHIAYQDRVYLNDGSGHFAIDTTRLPIMLTSTAAVAATDFDGDGDTDLFVGGRVEPGRYPTAPRSYLLENRNGKLVDVTAQKAAALQNPGMVTAALWTDFNQDHRPDLLVTGELMAPLFFENKAGQFQQLASPSGLEGSTGFWNCAEQADLDNDGDLDYLLGNLGLNTPYRISEAYPMQVHFADFDNNGAIDPLFAQHEENWYFSLASLDLLTGQLPKIKQALLYHSEYARTTLEQLLKLFPATKPQTLTCAEAASIVVENRGKGQFRIHRLPLVAQTSPVRGILTADFNADGQMDVLLTGNDFDCEVVSGRMDASKGVLLLNQGQFAFKAADPAATGLQTTGDTRSTIRLPWNDEKELIIIGRNNDTPETYVWHK